VSALLSSAADPAARAEHVNQTDTGGRTPLHHAAESDNATVVRELLGAGAAVNVMGKGGETPLLIAAQKGHAAVVELLLTAGAKVDQTLGDPHTENGLMPLRSTDTGTALHIAAGNGHATVVGVLLEKGAKVDKVNGDGDTPLHIAAGNRTVAAGLTVAVVLALLKKGADVHRMNRIGQTPLTRAMQQGRAVRVAPMLTPD